MDRDFLFGVIAVQLGQATPQQVMAAASAYLADKSRSIPERLKADGVFTAERFAMLSSMVDEALKAHGGDAKKTMHTLGGERAVYASFGGSLVVDGKGNLSITPKPPGEGRQSSITPKPPGEGGPDTSEDTVAVQPEAAGRYRLDANAEIGRGGIGRVLVAFDEFLGREIAVKGLLGEAGGSQPSTPRTDALSRTSAAVARFLREARVTGQLEHPNIVPVYEVGVRADGTFYYTMKLVRGRTMSKALKECGSLGDRLKLLHHYVDLCNAVAYAHSRGVVHRDLKTENVMLGEFGETVVLDWGLAKVQGKKDIRGGEIARELAVLQDAKSGHTVDGSAIGTPAYMSPEQADGRVEEIDARSDVWSLGAVLYEILTGRPPFEGYTPYEIIGKVLKDEVVAPKVVNAEVPAELSAVACKALTRDKSKRYQKAGDLSSEVQAYMTGGRISAYEYSSWELLKGFVAKHKVATALVGIIFALVVASSVVLYGAYKRAGAERGRAEQEKARAQLSQQISELNLAAALQEKADRLFEERSMLLSRLYSAASLSRHPCTTLGLKTARECDARFPGGALLRTRARSNIYQAGLHVLARPAWSRKLSTPLDKVHVTADGSRLVTLSAGGKAQLWSAEKRAPIDCPLGRSGEAVKSISMDPATGTIATCVEGAGIALWDRDGARLGDLGRAGGGCAAHSFSRDGSLLSVPDGKGLIEIWEVAGRSLVRTIDTGIAGIGVSATSPDGTVFAVAASDAVHLVDAASGEIVRTLADAGSVATIAFSPDGSLVAAGTHMRKIHVFDARSGKLVRTLLKHREGIKALSFSPDGRLLLSAANDGALGFWDGRNFELLDMVVASGPATDARFVPGGRGLVSCHEDGSLAAWSLEAGKRLPRFVGPRDRVWNVIPSADGRLLATSSADGFIYLWDLAKRELDKSLGYEGEAASSTSFSPDDRRIAGVFRSKSSQNSTVRVWDIATGNEVRAIEVPARLFSVEHSPDGRLLVTTAMNGTTVAWSAESGERLREIEKDGSGQANTRFSPDGRLLATGSADREVRLWDVASWRLLSSLKGHEDLTYNFDFSADGTKLLSCGKLGSIILWDVSTGKEIRRFAGHGRWVNRAVFLPGDRRLVSASDEGTVRLWSVDSGEQLLVLRTVREAYDAAPLGDGEQLAVIDGDGIDTVEVYPLDLFEPDADPAELLALAEREAGMRLDGFSLVPLQPDEPSGGKR